MTENEPYLNKLSYEQKKNIERMPEKAYIVWLSTGKNVQIDWDELPIFEQAAVKGKWAKVRQGYINPSFAVTVMLDYQRLHKLLTKQIEVIKSNSNFRELAVGEEQEVPTLTKLRNVTSPIDPESLIGTKRPEST